MRINVRDDSPIRVRRKLKVHENGVWACATGNHGKIADKIGKPAHGKISTTFILNLICDLRI